MYCLFRTTVRLGELDLNETVYDKSEPLDIAVDYFTLHKEYNPPGKMEDIAIIKMKTKVSFTGTLKSA